MGDAFSVPFILSWSSLFFNDDFRFLFVERRISQSQPNKQASQECQRMLIAVVFHSVDPVQTGQVKTSPDNAKLCQLHLSDAT